MASSPEVRAAMVKDVLALLEQGRLPRSKELLASIDPAYVARIAGCSRLEWIDAAPIVRIADTARAVVGPDQWQATHRALASDLVERPLFRAFFRGMNAVFGATPATHVKVFPMVFSQAHRNYGPVEFDAPPGAKMATVRFAKCAPEGLSLGLLEVFAGTIEGLVGSAARDATVRVEYAPGADNATLRLRWVE